MLTKKVDPFINLKEKSPDTMAMPVETKEKPESRGPSFYVSDIELPIDDKDLDNLLVAEIKLTPRRISKSTTNGKKNVSYDFEITGIRFKN